MVNRSIQEWLYSRTPSFWNNLGNILVLIFVLILVYIGVSK